MIADTRELCSLNLKDAAGGAFLAVRSVTAAVVVDGPLSETAITITFHNDRERTLEGDLVFPLPPSAALRELRVTVGKRTLRGKIRPRQRAQAEYTRAVQAGHTAALGETEGDDLARLRIAPIEKGEDVEVTLVLLHPLVPIDSGYRLLVPLTYMPRYVEPGSTLKDVERAAGEPPRPLTLAARATVTVRVRHPAEGPAPRLRCTSHSTQTETARGETVVTVGPVPLDRDLHLEIQDRPVGAEPALWIRHDAGDGPDALGPTTAVAIVPPAFADEGPAVPRTVTFLVDRSGSMDGGPMASAIRAVRGSLRALTADDRFNVIAFDTALEALAPRPVAFADDTLKASRRSPASRTPSTRPCGLASGPRSIATGSAVLRACWSLRGRSICSPGNPCSSPSGASSSRASAWCWRGSARAGKTGASSPAWRPPRPPPRRRRPCGRSCATGGSPTASTPRTTPRWRRWGRRSASPTVRWRWWASTTSSEE
jgi:hypothetical protein